MPSIILLSPNSLTCILTSFKPFTLSLKVSVSKNPLNCCLVLSVIVFLNTSPNALTFSIFEMVLSIPLVKVCVLVVIPLLISKALLFMLSVNLFTFSESIVGEILIFENLEIFDISFLRLFMDLSFTVASTEIPILLNAFANSASLRMGLTFA